MQNNKLVFWILAQLFASLIKKKLSPLSLTIVGNDTTGVAFVPPKVKMRLGQTYCLRGAAWNSEAFWLLLL